MKERYLLVFSSFYKAAYARDILSSYKLVSTIRKAPAQLASGCAYALEFKCSNIDAVLKKLAKHGAAPGRPIKL